MKLKNIYSSLLLFCLMMCVNSTFAKNVYDVFTNQSIETETYVKDFQPEISYFKSKVEILHFNIVNAKSSPYGFVNNQVFDICTYYLKNEVAALNLNSELSQRIKVMNELKNSRNNNNNYRDDYGIPILPSLKQIECEPISIVAGNLFFEVKFEFEMNTQQRYNDDDSRLYIIHYYVANLNSGVITRWKNNLNDYQLDLIQKQISGKLNEKYALATSKLKMSELQMMEDEENDEDYESNENEKPLEKVEECKDICTRLSLKDADFYWYAWGLIVEFQEYTYSSKIYYGQSFKLFLSFEEAKKMFSSFSEFSFLNKLVLPIYNLDGFNYMKIINSFGEIRRPPEIENVMGINPILQTPKSLLVERRQLFENGKSANQSKCTYDYSAQGLLLNKMLYLEREKLYQSDFYTYDANGNLKEHQSKGNNNEETSEVYVYDSKKNILSMISIENSEIDEKLYFYNGNYIYSFDMNSSTYSRENGVDRISSETNEFCFTNSCYILNKQGKVIGIRSLKYVGEQSQIGRDSLGRIVETHFDRDRYHYYWEYDNLNRFVKFHSYDIQNQVNEITYYYKENSMLPYKRISNSFNGGQITIQEEVYNWVFF